MIEVYKVLVVEDEYHIRNIIKEYFTLKDVEVIEACNGYEALDNLDESILGIINGYIELMEVIEDEEKRQEYLEAIGIETKHINELVQAMLSLSRLESGYVELDIQEVDMEDLLTSTIDLFAPLLEKKKIQIALQGEFDSIKVDPFEVQIVIKNFMSNAIKHTPHDGHIYISFNNNILSIENEGEHLSEEQKTRI